MHIGAAVFRGTTRFRLIRLIGRGGMGVVYEAFDEVNERSVALKLLPVVSPDLLLRFKREFRAFADVRHPNLVRLDELVSEGSQWFFTMELVDGSDVIAHVRASEGDPGSPRSVTASLPPHGSDAITLTAPGTGQAAAARAGPVAYDEGRLRAAFGQLAHALASLHAAGCVHRDVKPSNVMVTAEGRAVLLDFGLASTAAGESTLLGAGTPEYMAPEQVSEASIGPAADFYALGAMLFEVLTGDLPFGGLRHEILYRKTHGSAPRVGDLVSGAPPELAALCDRLLEQDPAARPTAVEIIATLAPPSSAVAGVVAGGEPAADQEPSPFVGREAELAELTTAFAAVCGGGGAKAIILRGESGVGKSTLARAFIDRQEDARPAEGAPILLTARCYERELVPFKAVDGLVDAVVHVLRKRETAFAPARLPRHVGLLVQTFPVLGRVDAIALAPHPPEGGDPREVRSSMFAAFRELVSLLAGERPVLAFIDDLQWADADSLALLAELLRPPQAPRLLLLGTLRTVSTAAAASPQRLLGADVPERHMFVHNLGDTEARALARDLLRVRAPERAEEWALLLATESDGHPLFLRELARTVHLRTGEEATLTLDGVLRARIESFPPTSVRVLRALAVASVPLAPRTLGQVVGLTGGAMASVLADLRAARLIHTAPGHLDDLVEITHDRIRQVARASASREEIQELHEQLAVAFEESGDPLRAAGHWREAGYGQRAASHLADAARRAAEALAFDRAAEHYGAALELGAWPDEKERELRVGLADALANGGRGAAAASHYLRAAQDGGATALALRRRGAEELIRSGCLDQGREVAAQALAEAGLGFSRRPLRALLFLRGLLRLRGLHFRRRSSDEIAPRQLARVDLCWSLSSGLGLMDPVQGAHFQVRSLILALRAGDSYRVARGIAGEAAYAAAQGNAPRARRMLAAAARIAADLANPHATGIVSLMSGLTSHLLGDFGAGLDHLQSASRTFHDRCVGTAWELSAARHFELECLYYLGEVGRFRALAAEGVREATDRGSVYAATTMRTGLGNAAWLLDDDPARAEAEATEAIGGWSSRGYHVQHWYHLMAMVQKDLYVGDGAAAAARIEGSWPALRQSNLLHMQHTRIVALHLRARAALAAAERAPSAQLLALARRCAGALTGEGRGWGPALAAPIRAGLLSLDGKREEAIAALQVAIGLAGTQRLALFRAAAQLAAREAYGDQTAGAAGARWMRESGIRAPEAMVRMLVPGVVRRA